MMRFPNLTPVIVLALVGWQVGCKACDTDPTDDSGTTDDSGDGCSLESPGVTFTSPDDGAILDPADNVGLRAELTGTNIDIDGVNVVFTIDGLPVDTWEWDDTDIVLNGPADVGAHGASVSVSDGCSTFSDDVSWIGNTAPDVTLSANASYEVGDPIVVSGTVADAEDPLSSLDVSWELDGDFYAAATPDGDGNVDLDLTGLAAGSYAIELLAADAYGEGSDSASFDVTEQPVVCVDVDYANLVLHMDEAAGDTLGDDSLLAQQATLNGSYAWTDGAWDGGVDLAAGAWIEVAEPAYPTIWSTDYTIAGWISRNGDELAINEALFQQGNGNGGTGRTLLYLTPECNGNTNVLVSSIGGEKVCGTTSIDGDGWHHVALVRQRSNSSVTLYLDGVQDGLGTSWMEFTDGEYLIGTNRTTDGNFFDGVVDEFVILDEALDEAAIAQLATGPACAPVCADLPAGPATWLNMDDGTGTVATDASGNGVDFTLVDGTWSDGTYGTAIDFEPAKDGSLGWAEAAAGTFPDLNATDFTISMRAIYDQEGGFPEDYLDNVLVQTLNGPTGQGRSLLFVREDCGDQAATFIGGEATCGGTLRGGVWYHLAVSYSHSTQEVVLYVDGVAKATATKAWEAYDGDLRLASNQTKGLWEGRIDDFLIYERVLSAEEMQDLHQGGSAYCLNP